MDTHARLVAGAAFAGAAIAPAVLDSCTEPPNAPTRFNPLQLPLKVELKLLSISGTLRLAAWANGPALPAASTAWTLNT